MKLAAFFIDVGFDSPGTAAPVAKAIDLFRVHRGVSLKVTGPSGDVRRSKESASLRCPVFQLQEGDILDYCGTRYEVLYVDDGVAGKSFICKRI